MRIYVDLRCLQGEGPGAALARALLKEARPCLGPPARLIGLLDEALPALSADCAALVDEARHSLEAPAGPAVLVQPAPLALDPSWPAPFLARASVLACAVVDEQTLPHEPAGRRRALADLVWLRRYDRFAAATPAAAQRLQTLLGLGPDRVAVTGGSARRLWAEVCRWGGARGARRGGTGASRPRLAVLSPYPPDRSGVADYTAACLRSLAARAVVDVFTGAAAPRPDPWVRRFAPLGDEPYVSGEYDRVLAVLSNHPLHAPILELHGRYGGACLIHDNRLTEIYAWLRGPERFARMASRSLGRPVGVEEVQEWLLDTHRLAAPCFDEVVLKAEPLLVHSRGIQARVRQQYGRAAARLPFCCYRRFDPAELTPASRRAARARLGFPDGRILILSAGVVTPARGPLECIWAVEQLRAWGVPADLHFVGPAPFLAATLRLWVGRLGLEDHVRILDEWVPETTYRDYLLAADLALQLKAPGFVGLSGSAVDCLGAGLPTAMNDALAEAMEAPGYVGRVPDHFSPVLIAERLSELLESGRWHDRLGPERAAYVAAHSFERYADELLRALEVA